MPQRLRIPLCAPASVPVPPPVAPGARRVGLAILRGLMRRCPRCGVGEAMEGYLGVRRCCSQCGEELGRIKADDGPAYFTVLIAGHVAVPVLLMAEQTWHPPLAPTLAVALTGMGLLIWRLLPRVKGGVIGLMWALGLKGDEVQGDVERHG